MYNLGSGMPVLYLLSYLALCWQPPYFFEEANHLNKTKPTCVLPPLTYNTVGFLESVTSRPISISDILELKKIVINNSQTRSRSQKQKPKRGSMIGHYIMAFQ